MVVECVTMDENQSKGVRNMGEKEIIVAKEPKISFAGF